MRISAITVALILTTALACTASPATAQEASRAAGDSPTSSVATKFAMKTMGFGTRVTGGQVPAQSDTTAFQIIGCTNRAGLDRINHEAAVELPGAGVVEGVKTRVWTSSGTASEAGAHSVHNVARVSLGDPSMGNLELTAVNSHSDAFHDATGFHAEASTSIGAITFAAPGQDPQSFEIPTPDQPLVIPGVASISIGSKITRSGAGGAFAAANAVDIKLLVSGTRVRIAHSIARINPGVTRGLFRGHSNATSAHGLDENVHSGPTPLKYIPCQGTRGKVRERHIAYVNLGDNIVVGAVSAFAMGKQNTSEATGFMQGRVASIDLGDGQLVVTAIQGRVNVTLDDTHGLVTDIKGTQIGSITANGSPQEFPDTGVLEIPGVARLERSIIEKLPHGLSVTALRITLLDGSGAVINLGEATLKIRRSGNKLPTTGGGKGG